MEEKNTSKNYTYEELLDIEKCVRILCEKYENESRINNLHMDKFKKYNELYNKIIDEIENKINETLF